ncbi:MAG: flagellar hook-basal body protein, partial [Candidatus Puniceispirillum sp.]
MSSWYVTEVEGISLTGASPDFTREQFLAHSQAKINQALNDYAVDRTTDTVDGASALGVANQLFGRASGTKMDAILTSTQIVDFNHVTSSAATPAVGTISTSAKSLVYSYQGSRPTLSVYDNKAQVAGVAGNTVVFDATQNTMTINLGSAANISINEKIRIAGEFTPTDATAANVINGREFTVSNVSGNSITINTTGLSFPDDGFTLSETNIYVLSDESETVEAFFEGATNVYEGAAVNFSSEKIILREKDSDTKHAYTNKQIATVTGKEGIFEIGNAQFNIQQGGLDSLDILGLKTSGGVSDISITTDWVDEKAPAIKVTYDEITQRLQFQVDRTVLGTGTDSNFNSFSVFGAANAEESNNLGIPTQDDAEEVLIRGGEVLSTEPFVADGEEIQLNDKRYGVTVKYNSDTQTFSFASGTTGELIAADGALGVTDQQSASQIVVGRYSLSEVNGSVIDVTDHFSGDNHLMSVGVSKSDAILEAGRGLASTPASAAGDAATENLSNVFRLTNTNGENVFNVSVNGISGIIELPTGFYVGSTLAEALQSRINQIQDPVTGASVGGVTVKYDPSGNNFTFVTGT